VGDLLLPTKAVLHLISGLGGTQPLPNIAIVQSSAVPMHTITSTATDNQLRLILLLT